MNDLAVGTALRTPSFSPARLRAARRAAGLSQFALAVAIGRTPATIQGYEYGTSPPSVTSLVALVAALRLDNVGDLFDHPTPGAGDAPGT